jgi:uncharacterized protein (TIGR03083 family)
MDTADTARTDHTPGPRTIAVSDLSPIGRDAMVGLATTEYRRLVPLLRSLAPGDWRRPTACEGWTVHDMVAHLLGAAESNASIPESVRQLLRGRRWARVERRPLVDGINEIQIADRRHLRPEELTARLEQIADRAVRGRRRTPAPVRRVRVPAPLGGSITMGELVDVIYTRDQWMHRIDVARATGRDLELTADHDGRIVADLVRDWALAHGEPVMLELTGPAGGTFRQGSGGPTLTVDAVDFALATSGRVPAQGLLAVPVVF